MLQLKNLIKTAFKSIFKNRMRSLLTSLGIIIGVSAVIVMVAIGEGSQRRIEEGIQSLGTNLIVVFQGRVARGESVEELAVLTALPSVISKRLKKKRCSSKQYHRLFAPVDR